MLSYENREDTGGSDLRFHPNISALVPQSCHKYSSLGFLSVLLGKRPNYVEPGCRVGSGLSGTTERTLILALNREEDPRTCPQTPAGGK